MHIWTPPSSSPSTPDQKERLDLFDKTFKLTEYLAAIGSGEGGPETVAEVKRYFTERIAPDSMTVVERLRKDRAAFDKIVDGVAKLPKK